MERTYTVREIAEILGYSTNSVYSFLKKQRIKGIRLGKGRFRISQEELSRILHTSKTNTLPSVSKDITIKKKIYPIRCSLFDWFLGVVSILIGISLALFSIFYIDVGIRPYLNWIISIQASFIAGGIGVLLCNIMTDKKSLTWLKIFYGLLIIAYTIFALIKWQMQQNGSALLFGLFPPFIVFNAWANNRRALTFILFCFLYSLLIPVSIILNFPITLPDFAQFVYGNHYLFGGLWLLIVLLVIGPGIWSYFHNKKILNIISGIMAVIFISLSMWFADILAWQTSITALMMGLGCLVIPRYEKKGIGGGKEQKMTFILSIVTIILLSLMLGVIWITQRNITEFANREELKKTQVGELIVEEFINNNKNILEKASRNALFTDSLTDKNANRLNELAKNVFQSGDGFLRILVWDGQGNVITVYPHDAALEGHNLSYREHFKKTMATGKTFISDQFESARPGGQLVEVVSTPVFGINNEPIGVISGTLNMALLSDELQKLTDVQNGEYFTMIDRNGKRIIHPNIALIGKEIEEDSILRQGLAGKTEGVGEAFNYERKRMLQSFAQINNSTWVIGSQMEIGKILKPTRIVSYVLYLTIAVMIFSFELYSAKRKY